MRHKRRFLFALIVLLATPLLACNPNVLNAWGDLLASARFVWDSIWTVPEPDYEAIGILCTESLLATFGEPPVAYVDAIAMTTQEIAAAWGVTMPYSATFTLGTPYTKPDGSGRIMVPLQFANPSGAYGVPVGGPVTGLCLEFEQVDEVREGRLQAALGRTFRYVLEHEEERFVLAAEVQGKIGGDLV